MWPLSLINDFIMIWGFSDDNPDYITAYFISSFSSFVSLKLSVFTSHCISGESIFTGMFYLKFDIYLVFYNLLCSAGVSVMILRFTTAVSLMPDCPLSFVLLKHFTVGLSNNACFEFRKTSYINSVYIVVHFCVASQLGQHFLSLHWKYCSISRTSSLDCYTWTWHRCTEVTLTEISQRLRRNWGCREWDASCRFTRLHWLTAHH